LAERDRLRTTEVLRKYPVDRRAPFAELPGVVVAESE
jgi:hypothetical protein